MNRTNKFYCPKCGKILNGITLDYRLDWFCSSCASDQREVLHCERGCKVKAVDLDSGTRYDSEKAREFLTKGQIYEVEKLHIGGCMSHIRLKEFPHKWFNSVHFIRWK